MMNRHVNAISGRLSLRAPQRYSLEILDRITEIAPPKKDTDVQAALAAIRAEFPGVMDFEREFPSVCFALATGVGKTRLMGAFISYLHLAHGFSNFFVMAPNLTIYNKLITDFTPNTPKYVFKGISEFATDPPAVITGETYEQEARTLFDELIRCKVNIFNISKINSEVRGGKAPRIKRLSEYIGESYFEYLAGLPDLVLLMDESHRYRASAGVRAINELKPVLGLELTATPFVETSRGSVPFKNVIFDYPLARAMADGFVKEPAVVTRKDFNPTGMSPEEIERLKLEDGVRRQVSGDRGRSQSRGFGDSAASVGVESRTVAAKDRHGCVSTATGHQVGLSAGTTNRQHLCRRGQRTAGIYQAGRTESRADCLRSDSQTGESAARSAFGRAPAKTRSASRHRPRCRRTIPSGANDAGRNGRKA